MQRGPNQGRQPGAAGYNPAGTAQRPVQARPGAQPTQPAAGRRPMTRAEYEYMRRRQKQQNMLAIGAIAAVLVIVIIIVVMILTPNKPKEDKAVPVVNEIVQQESIEQASPQAEDTQIISDDPDTVIPGDGSGEGAEAPETEITPVATPMPASAANTTPRLEGELRSVRMRVAGDVMVTMDQIKYAVKANYSFNPQFELIADVMSNADYTMANMETTVGKYKDKDYSGYPLFNAPEQILDSMQLCGVDMLTLANNHMLDRWFDGMKNTVNWVEKYGFDHVGAYRTKEERNTPVIKEIGGIKFGFLAYTHSTNTQETVCDKAAVEYGVPYLHKSNVTADIKRLKDAGAEVIIAFPHWGDEYVQTPNSYQKKYAKKLAEAGVDVILGSHSHTVQPMGYQKVKKDDGTTKEVFTIFSLGNFISTHTLEFTDSGVILDFTINEQPDGTFTCDDVRYIPTYCWIHDGTVQVVSSGQYLDTPPAGMSSADHSKLVKAYNDVVNVLGTDFGILTH